MWNEEINKSGSMVAEKCLLSVGQAKNDIDRDIETKREMAVDNEGKRAQVNEIERLNTLFLY